MSLNEDCINLCDLKLLSYQHLEHKIISLMPNCRILVTLYMWDKTKDKQRCLYSPFIIHNDKGKFFARAGVRNSR